MSNYLKTLLAMLLNIHRIHWLPTNDFGREKRLGLAAIGVLVFMFFAVVIYRTQKNGEEPDFRLAQIDPSVAKEATGPTPTPRTTPASSKQASPTNSPNALASQGQANPAQNRYAQGNAAGNSGGSANFASAPKPNGFNTPPAGNPSAPQPSSVATDRYGQANDSRYASPPSATDATTSRYAAAPAGPTAMAGDSTPQPPKPTAAFAGDSQPSPYAATAGDSNPLRATTARGDWNTQGVANAPTPALTGTLAPASDATPATVRTDPRVTPTSSNATVASDRYGQAIPSAPGYASAPNSLTTATTAPAPASQGYQAPPSYAPAAKQPAQYQPTALAASPASHQGTGYNPAQPAAAPTTATATASNHHVGASISNHNNVHPVKATATPASVTRPAIGQPAAGSKVHIVREGETLFDIARNELGKASHWAEIYRLNRERIGDDFDYLAPGTQLVLPDLATTATGERQPLTTSRGFPSAR